MNTKKLSATVVNFSDYALKRKYIVARCAEAELWFYGAWDDKQKAIDVAIEIGNGVVLENEEVQ